METVLRDLRYPFGLLVRALIVVGLIWAVVAVARARRMPLDDAIKISVAEALFAASLTAIWVFTIVRLSVSLPGQYAPPLGVNWVPVVPIVQGLLSTESDIIAFNLLGNVALFVPLGAATLWRFNVGPWRVLALGLVLSVAIEAWQTTFSPTERSGDVNDVILNGLGVLIGAFGMLVMLRLKPSLAIRAWPAAADRTKVQSSMGRPRGS